MHQREFSFDSTKPVSPTLRKVDFTRSVPRFLCWSIGEWEERVWTWKAGGVLSCPMSWSAGKEMKERLWHYWAENGESVELGGLLLKVTLRKVWGVKKSKGRGKGMWEVLPMVMNWASLNVLCKAGVEIRTPFHLAGSEEWSNMCWIVCL